MLGGAARVCFPVRRHISGERQERRSNRLEKIDTLDQGTEQDTTDIGEPNPREAVFPRKGVPICQVLSVGKLSCQEKRLGNERRRSSSVSICRGESCCAPALGIITISTAGKRECWRSRKNSRNNRFIRFRSTDLPNLREVVMPRRDRCVRPGAVITKK